MMMAYPKFLVLLFVAALILGQAGCTGAETKNDIQSVSSAVSKGEKNILDLENFVGERIVVNEFVGPRLDRLNFKLTIPAEYKLLEEAHSELKLVSSQKLIGDFKLDNLSSSFKVDGQVTSDHLYVKLSLFYCREGKTGLCLMRNVLFDVPVDKNARARDLDLNYTVPAEPL